LEVILRYEVRNNIAMYDENNKRDYKYTTNIPAKREITNSRIFISMFMSLIISLMATGIVLSILTIQRVDAQMSNSSGGMGGSMAGSMMSSGKNSNNNNMSMGSNMMAIPAKAPQLNITTAAPPISPTIFKSLSLQIHVDLINATMIAQKWVGGNSHAVSSMVALQNGTPVYTIWVIDNNSGLHQILVDPQNGKVVFANQPMSMTGPFS